MRLAGRLRGIGGYLADVDVIESTIAGINRLYCDPPLNANEIHAIAQTSKRWTPGSNEYQGMSNVED